MSLLRRIMIEKRNRLEGREEKNGAIFERFFEIFPVLKRVFIYVDFRSEVETKRIIERLLSQGTRVFCPKMFGRDMEFFEISALSELSENEIGIPEPPVPDDFPVNAPDEALSRKYRLETPDRSEGELMVVPGVLFDENGGRVGYGLGCYDRYLAVHPALSLALAFDMQVRKEPLIQKESDVLYDMLLSETRFIDRRTI